MTEKYKPFDLEAALRGEPLITRDGRKVINFVQLAPMENLYPFAACVDVIGIETYTKEGLIIHESSNEGGDLFMAPKPKKKLWIAISKNLMIDNIHQSSCAYPSKELLLENLENNEFSVEYFEIIEIEIEDK